MRSLVKNDIKTVSTHSRAEAAAGVVSGAVPTGSFQHTAARRRLPTWIALWRDFRAVSTHSRAEAAAYMTCGQDNNLQICFNTQPRGGGCWCECWPI